MRREKPYQRYWSTLVTLERLLFVFRRWRKKILRFDILFLLHNFACGLIWNEKKEEKNKEGEKKSEAKTPASSSRRWCAVSSSIVSFIRSLLYLLRRRAQMGKEIWREEKKSVKERIREKKKKKSKKTTKHDFLLLKYKIIIWAVSSFLRLLVFPSTVHLDVCVCVDDIDKDTSHWLYVQCRLW